MFTGVYTALITPFTKGGNIDESALRALVDNQIARGIQGLVPVGTTGESPTVTHEENLRIIEIVIDETRGRVPVIAGTGSNSTEEALDMTRKAKALGADGTLQVVPYYNRPNQEGLFRHFMTLAESVDLPMILYNHPGRTGKYLETATILRLAKHPNIACLKDATGAMQQTMELLAAKPANFSILSGDDNITLPLMSLGAHGVISVASNVVPEDMRALCDAMAAGELSKARDIHYRLMALFAGLNLDTNPIPVKYAMSLLGTCNESYRLPLWPMAESAKAQLSEIMKSLKLI